MQASRPALAHELLHEEACLLLYKGVRAPAEGEWEAYLDVCRAALPPYGNRLRFFVWNEDGDMPREIQAQTTEMMRGYTHKVAVISSSVVMRFIVSIFVLWNRNIRFFSPAQRDDALLHLGCDKSSRDKLNACMDRLRARVEGPSVDDYAAPHT